MAALLCAPASIAEGTADRPFFEDLLAKAQKTLVDEYFVDFLDSFEYTDYEKKQQKQALILTPENEVRSVASEPINKE